MAKQAVMNGLNRTKEIRACMGIDEGKPFEAGPREISQAESIVDVKFFKLNDTDLVGMFERAFGPELETLKNAEPTAETGAKETPGDLGRRGDKSPSRLLYRSDYPEVNRSIVGVLALKWVVNEEWEKFSKYQLTNRINKKAFKALRDLVLGYLDTPEKLYALVVTTIVNDLGKNKALAKEITTDGIENVESLNHDQIMYLAADQIEIFNEFPPENPIRQALVLGLRFGAELNVPQFIQAENVPGSLRAVSLFKGQPDALHIKFLEILFDVAGAMGHRDSRCALIMTQYVWMSYRAAGEILTNILEDKMPYREGYDKFLRLRASILEENGFQTLNVEDLTERALLRLLTMARVTDPDMAKLFDTAFHNLDANIREDLVNGLSVDGVNDGTAIIPYYFPAVFANAMGAFKDKHDSTKIAVLGAIYRLLARVLAKTEPKHGLGKDLIVECNMEFAQSTIKSADFIDKPSILDNVAVPEKAYSKSPAEWV